MQLCGVVRLFSRRVVGHKASNDYPKALHHMILPPNSREIFHASVNAVTDLIATIFIHVPNARCRAQSLTGALAWVIFDGSERRLVASATAPGDP